MVQWCMKALASHQCWTGFNRFGICTCGLSLLVLYSTPRGFSPVTLVFQSTQKTTYDFICFNLT